MSEETSAVVAGKAARLVKDLDAALTQLKKAVRLIERHRKNAASVAMSALTQATDRPTE